MAKIKLEIAPEQPVRIVKSEIGTIGPPGPQGPREIYVQSVAPIAINDFIWVQTNIGGDPDAFTFWFNDGA